MTSFVTGATGFVGSAIVKQLLATGESVRALVRPDSDRRNLEGLPIEIVPGDLSDQRQLEKALQGCQALFHVAANYRLWAPRSREFYDINVQGTRNIILAAAEAGVKRIVYTSSVATLGLNPDRTPADEDTASSLEAMIGHYKRSKFLAEEAVKELMRQFALNVVIVNPSTPVGPRDIKPTPTGRVIVTAASGNMPAYMDTGLSIVHVDDVAAGHLLAFEKGESGARYILGGENITLHEIFNIVSQLTGLPPPRVRLSKGLVLPLAYLAQGWARLTHGKEPMITVDGVRMARKHMFFSSTKAEQALGYKFRPATEAIHDAIVWFRTNRYL
jgi:dihydroflavonol-4-reductase